MQVQIFFLRGDHTYCSENDTIKSAKEQVETTMRTDETLDSAIIFKEGVPILSYDKKHWHKVNDYNI